MPKIIDVDGVEVTMSEKPGEKRPLGGYKRTGRFAKPPPGVTGRQHIEAQIRHTAKTVWDYMTREEKSDLDDILDTGDEW